MAQKFENLTPATKELFFTLAKDASNWSGTPLISITKEERGNLTQLKRAGLITTFDSDGDQFVQFTMDGEEVAANAGIDLGM